jgi:hypothetical protein
MHGGLQVLCVWRRVALAGTAPLKRLFRISSTSAIAMQPTFFTSPLPIAIREIIMLKGKARLDAPILSANAQRSMQFAQSCQRRKRCDPACFRVFRRHVLNGEGKTSRVRIDFDGVAVA